MPGTRLSIFERNFQIPGRAMALSLNDKETDRLAREIASLTGETLTGAERQALAERLQRGQPTGLAERLLALGRECAARPDFDTRTPDQIVGYDETGMWT